MVSQDVVIKFVCFFLLCPILDPDPKPEPECITVSGSGYTAVPGEQIKERR
jgi:hypothetical protein